MAQGLTVRSYSEFVDEIALYPARKKEGGVSYCIHGLTGEAGEVADKFKKILRDHDGVVGDREREAMLHELGDVLWYLSALADELDSSLEEVAVVNIEKLKARRANSTLQGEGDDR